MSILVTGGAGFIGANFVLEWLNTSNKQICVLDKLTYAGNLMSLEKAKQYDHFSFIQGDIGDKDLIRKLLNQFNIHSIINFAAESHVDRSISDPEDFIQTNIVGTFRLLEATRQYWKELSSLQQKRFSFLHVSTDEVYGSLALSDSSFTEETPYKPNSPYSASKAASDHLVRSYYHTYELPVLTTNCSNNYGPFQFPEKLIPLTIHNALSDKPIPVYGDGMNIRDWLFVTDHCKAIQCVLEKGELGQVYNIGGLNEKTNLEVVHAICELLDELKPKQNGISYKNQIQFVKDRAGHDKRYAVNATKLIDSLDWKPKESFETGIRKTVRWYLEHQDWVKNVTDGTYLNWIKRHYA